MSRREGSVLILAVLLALVIGGLTFAVFQTCFAYHRSSTAALENEFATRAAESGVGYYLAQIASDPGYFDGYATPSEPVSLAGASFVLESVSGDSSTHEWKLAVTGRYGRVDTTIGAVIGYRRVRIPTGLVVGGTGSPSDVTLNLDGGSSIGSYDSSVTAFDINHPGDAAGVTVNGSVDLGGGTSISGDLVMTGEVVAGGTSGVTGTTTELAEAVEYDPIDDMVAKYLEDSKASNDNATLASVFGTDWTPVADGENYGDLVVTSGTHVVPSGTYRFRRFEVRNGAEVIFDTSDGPTNIVYMGDGGSSNELLVGDVSTVSVRPGATTHGLRTILAPSADFRVEGNSSFGQAPDTYDPSSASYTKIMSLGSDPDALDPEDDIVVQANSSVYGQLYADAHDLLLKGNSAWYGSALSRTLTVAGSQAGPAVFAVDEAVAGSFLTDPSNYDVLAKWPVDSPEA